MRIKNISKRIGGKQMELRDTKILAEQGYLGKFKNFLQHKNTQYAFFFEDDDGPFWMTPEKCEYEK